MREIYDKIQGQTLGSWCIAHEKLPSSEDAASQGHEKSFALQISSYVWSGETPSFYVPQPISPPKTHTYVSHVISVSILAVHFIILLFAFAWKYEFPVLSCYLHPGFSSL